MLLGDINAKRKSSDRMSRNISELKDENIIKEEIVE